MPQDAIAARATGATVSNVLVADQVGEAVEVRPRWSLNRAVSKSVENRILREAVERVRLDIDLTGIATAFVGRRSPWPS